ncbi:unnamed protein product [Nezara viridula]|uniref:Uncharacterized protein n=1 Tax=Nezara viridula TaxID=85310 RepID=A0A9P0HAL7_NEZVI|nr:unnamed protein product [Nezara viridula]
METDNELTSGTQTGTEETVGSSDINADEAEAITRSMDMSIAFWGTSKEPPEKIPATRLKCPLQNPGKASSVALKIWEKMTQRDLDKVKEIEVSLMTEGEIGTVVLFNALKYIIESIGMEFEEMLKSVDEDPIESTISLTNEILHIFNLNEPPEIVEDEECSSYIHYSPISNVSKQTEKQRKDISNKMKILINKAHEMGIHDVRVPSSPYLSERSKLSLIEKQITSKMKLRNVKKIFEDTERGTSECSFGESKFGQSLRYQRRKSAHQKKDPKRPTLADRPKFRSAVKAESLRYEDLFKQTPDITKRIRKVREIRKKFMEKSKNGTDGKSSSNLYNVRNTRNRYLATPFSNYSNYSLAYKGRTPRLHKRYHLPQMHNSRIRDYSLNDNKSSTRGRIGSTDELQSEDFQQASNILQRHGSRDKMLYEMKKMVNEAVQAVKGSNRLKHSICLPDEKKTFRIKAREKNRNSKTGMSDISHTMQSTTNSDKSDNSNFSNDKKKNETFVTVKQEAGLQNINKEENKVSTEVKVSRDFGGPGLKVSVISKVSGNEETEDMPQPRSTKDIREAISILKEYIALKNNENLGRLESKSVHKGKDRSLMLTSIKSDELFKEKNTTSETVAKTEVIIEPNSLESIPKEEAYEEEAEARSNENSIWNISQEIMDEEADRTYQTYAVTMLMPMDSGVEDTRFYSPFQFENMFLNRTSNRFMQDQIGDLSDNGWSSWDSPIWHSLHMDDGFTTTVRNESDSLYVNTSEEHMNYDIGETGEDISIMQHQQINTTISTMRYNCSFQTKEK